MSWSWNTDEEEKEYEIKGSVTISTQEYRDLIQRVADLKVAGQKEHDDWYSAYNKNQALEKELKLFKDKVSEFNEWLAKNEAVLESFKAWKREKLINECEEEGNSD